MSQSLTQGHKARVVASGSFSPRPVFFLLPYAMTPRLICEGTGDLSRMYFYSQCHLLGRKPQRLWSDSETA